MTSGLQVVLADRSLRQTAMEMVERAGAQGITVAEAREMLPARHHGHVSGVFSIQHQRGNIARLAEERDGYKIYVHPDATYGRPTEAHGRAGGLTREEIEWAISLRSTMEYWFEVTQDGTRFGTERERVDQPGNRPLFVRQMREMWEARPR